MAEQMMSSYNVPNNAIYKVNNNVNNEDNGSNVKFIKRADRIADQLEAKLGGGEKSRPFYCKVAYELTEGSIFSNLELALKGRSPQRYFTWLCKKSMNKS